MKENDVGSVRVASLEQVSFCCPQEVAVQDLLCLAIESRESIAVDSDQVSHGLPPSFATGQPLYFILRLVKPRKVRTVNRSTKRWICRHVDLRVKRRYRSSLYVGKRLALADLQRDRQPFPVEKIEPLIA